LPVSVANSQLVYDAMKSVGVELVSALPETWLVHLIRIADEDPDMTLVRLAREEEGVGVSAGAHFAGVKSAMLMQNHGLFQAINGIVGVSLLYKIPLLMLITDRGSFGEGPFDSPLDFTLYDRCITRGIVGGVMPVPYGNGNRILQTPNSFIISYEMIHDTRVVPLDGRPHIGRGIRQYLGDSRGHFEGDTLVIETTNFTDQTSVQGGNGNGLRHSADMKMTERFTRLAKDVLEYRITIDDPKTFTRPITFTQPNTLTPDGDLLEYFCTDNEQDSAHFR